MVSINVSTWDVFSRDGCKNKIGYAPVRALFAHPRRLLMDLLIFNFYQTLPPPPLLGSTNLRYLEDNNIACNSDFFLVPQNRFVYHQRTLVKQHFCCSPRTLYISLSLDGIQIVRLLIVVDIRLPPMVVTNIDGHAGLNFFEHHRLWWSKKSTFIRTHDISNKSLRLIKGLVSRFQRCFFFSICCCYSKT